MVTLEVVDLTHTVWAFYVVLRLSSAYIAICSMVLVRQLARQKSRGRPAQTTDPSLVNPARRLAAGGGGTTTSFCQRPSPPRHHCGIAKGLN